MWIILLKLYSNLQHDGKEPLVQIAKQQVQLFGDGIPMENLYAMLVDCTSNCIM